MLKNSDLGNGTYQNPVLYGDYSDPDVIRVGSDYYMVSSSFCNSPAIPLLHSKDLVNWKVINYVCQHVPGKRYRNPIHGCGVWAPSIRYHKNEFYVYFPMPDEGIYVCKTKDPYKEWSAPVCILEGSGFIDPCPFWDDDGNAYLIHAVAFSRCGKKSLLLIAPMASDGLALLGEPRPVYDGNNTENETIEGPKLYKRNGYYYIFAPAGGVKVGHQTVLRSKEIYGPYEYRIVLKQGSSEINGPHQGAWAETPEGGHFFLHFQDVYAGGRILHMQPMKWQDDWPVIGSPVPGTTYGEPVLVSKKPETNSLNNSHGEIFSPDYNDSFSGPLLGLQWQWNANFDTSWYSLQKGKGLILNAIYKESERPLCDVPNLLLQKWPAPEFSCTTVMDCSDLQNGESAGIVTLGKNYAGLCLTKLGETEYVLHCIRGIQDYGKEAIAESKSVSFSFNDHTSVAEEQSETIEINHDVLKASHYEMTFRLTVKIQGYRDYLDRLDYRGQEQWAKHIPQEEITLFAFYKNSNTPFFSCRIPATAGRWVGVKNGVFCVSKNRKPVSGFAAIKSVIYE